MVMPVKCKGILITMFGIYARYQWIKVKVMCWKLECR